MLNGFSNTLIKNQRGRFIQLEYAEIEGIEKFYRISQNGIIKTAPVFKQGYDWRILPLNQKAINWYSVQANTTKQGSSYVVTIEGSFPVVDGLTQEEFDKMLSPQAFVVKITTPDNLKFLMSVKEFPAEFSFKTDGGNAEVNMSRVTWQFKAELPFPIAQILT